MIQSNEIKEKQLRSLIIAAHGSRKKESNKELAALAVKVAQKDTLKSYDDVDHAFLQIAEPLLENKILEKIESGAKDIVIFPFFIGSGSHILIDIPNLVNEFKIKYPDVGFTLTNHLGMLKAIEDVIINEVEAISKV